MMRLISIILIMFFIITIFAQEEGIGSTSTSSLQHRVPLSDIIIDDFSNFSSRFLPYSEASESDILRARNRQRPFCSEDIDICLHTLYEDGATANQWLSADSLVLGYVTDKGNAYAFPFEVLSFHSLVNDVIDEEPVLIAYCFHCNSANIFSRRFGSETLTFGNMDAYYQNVRTMYDIQTESLWLTLNGQGILGHYTDTELTSLPSIVSSWELWADIHPQTQVLARYEQYVDYNQDFFRNNETRLNLGRFAFPVSDDLLRDGRLGFGEPVLIVEHGREVVAYPLEALGNAATINIIDGSEITVLSLHVGENTLGAAYLTRLDSGSSLELRFDEETSNWRDMISGSTVDFRGRTVHGPLEGQQLTPAFSSYMYWFAAVVAYPTASVYQHKS